MPSVAMVHEVDPRKELQARVGDISDIEVFGKDVLVAIYERPTLTKSGIILPDQTRGEDRYQGKVGLVLKNGPLAFDDLKPLWSAEVGDWVFFRAADGWDCTLNTLGVGAAKDNTVLLRMVADGSIRGRVQHPDRIY